MDKDELNDARRRTQYEDRVEARQRHQSEQWGDGFVAGAEHGRLQERKALIAMLRDELSFQCKIDKGFEPTAPEVLEGLIAALEKQAG